MIGARPLAARAAWTLGHAGLLLSYLGGATLVMGNEPELRRVGVEPATGGAKAVVVRGYDLIHVTQLLPLDASGQLVGAGDVERQLQQLSSNLRRAVELSGSDVGRVAKLNLYVANSEVAALIREWFQGLDANVPRPALSFVVTPLPHPGALVGLDAVVAAPTTGATEIRRVSGAADVGGRLDHAAIVMPHGNRVYIAGQAERGDGSLADATRQTLASLGRTLEFLGLRKSDVVQVKSFMTPMSGIEDVEREVTAFFGEGQAPAVAVVQWESTLPIEIELVVSAHHTARGLDAHEVIEFLTPPDMTASPVYSRVARVLGPSTIYTTGIYAQGKDLSGEAEVVSAFEQLKAILDATGSDLQHLAKATYYVANNETSNELNRLRPNYYHPERPPSASKAVIAGTGREGVWMTIDLIATQKP